MRKRSVSIGKTAKNGCLLVGKSDDANMVKVVRCFECIYCHPEISGIGRGIIGWSCSVTHLYHEGSSNMDGYCSYATAMRGRCACL